MIVCIGAVIVRIVVHLPAVPSPPVVDVPIPVIVDAVTVGLVSVHPEVIMQVLMIEPDSGVDYRDHYVIVALGFVPDDARAKLGRSHIS